MSPGSAVLSIHLHFAGTHDDTGQSVFLGQLDENYALPALRGSALSDYEGYVDAGLGLDRRAGFRVFELTSPTRLVIDVHH